MTDMLVPSALVGGGRIVWAAALCLLPQVRGLEYPDSSDPGRLARQAEELKTLLELASSSEFYLLLDSDRRILRLKHGGAVLREFSVLDAKVGRPGFLWMRRRVRPDVLRRTWEAGTLHPARVIERVGVVPPAGPADSVIPYIPPPPEEAIAAPARYRIRYRDGAELEVVADRAPVRRGLARWLLAVRFRLEDAIAALGLTPSGMPRLRLILPADEAAALYRSFPEGTRFYVLYPCAPRALAGGSTMRRRSRHSGAPTR